MDAASTIVIEVHHDGERGNVELMIGEWEGSHIDITFRDRLYRNSGVIRFEGEKAVTLVRPSRPYTGRLADPQQYNEYFASIAKMFATSYAFGWSPDPESMISYDADYHSCNNYIQGDPLEISIKKVQAKIIEELAAPRKCVIAGCSNGELVRQCHDIGIDAWGFDVIPNIRDIAFPEVREFLRMGSLTDIPYSQEDGFDTLIAIDVLEHIPERDIPHMIDQWSSLGVRKLILLINLNQFWFPGHITLRPPWWWEKQWQSKFRHVSTTARFPHLPTVYSNAGLYNQQWTLWERQPGSK
jgi:hypothetical protein